jgi:hypothetical protein
VDVRIGVTQSPREIEIELTDDTDLDAIRKQIDVALAEEGNVLWLTDKRGRQVGVPSVKIAYVEIGSPSDKGRIGFG